VPVIAIALALSFTTYEFNKPAYAKGPVASPTATPLDDNSVSALLSLDQAMETLAARVTPAVVNVAVTSHSKTEMADGQMPELPEGVPPMFAPFLNHPGRQQQQQIEHGIGSGVLISPRWLHRHQQSRNRRRRRHQRHAEGSPNHARQTDPVPILSRTSP